MIDFERGIILPKFKVNVIRCNDDVAIQVIYGRLNNPTECVNTCFMFTDNPDVLVEGLETVLNSLMKTHQKGLNKILDDIVKRCEPKLKEFNDFIKGD